MWFRCDLGQPGPPTWINEQLERTLSYWLVRRTKPRDRWYGFGLPPPQEEELPCEDLTIQLESALQDIAESLDDVKKRWKRQADQAIDLHFEAVHEWVRDNGYAESHQLLAKHFDWAVRFQVAAEPVRSIEATVRREEKFGDVGRNIRIFIRRVLNLVGLDRRSERPGPKSKQFRKSLGPASIS